MGTGNATPGRQLITKTPRVVMLSLCPGVPTQAAPTIEEFLAANLKPGEKVGLDPLTVTFTQVCGLCPSQHDGPVHRRIVLQSS